MAVWRDRSGPAARWSGLLLLTMGVCASAGAQEGVTIKRDLRAVRLSTPPVIDGDLSDPCWQQAAKADRFVDVLYSTPVADQTVAYLGYDDSNIYVAFYAYDSQPSGIVARETKRGTRFTGYDDFVAIAIDPFHTHKFVDRSFFIVNPRGTQFARLSGQRATKLEWEGQWQSAARVVADGWTAELAIPWRILNYPQVKGPTTCGLNMDRTQQRTKIHSLWCNFGPQELNELEGHWVGIEFPPFHPQFSVLPYAAPGWEEGEGFGARAGADFRSRLTPTLSLIGTVNPDFRNVEGAVEGIDFSYGPRFVPDRRPFFQEGADTYAMFGIDEVYFYSLRVGAFDTGLNLWGKLTPRDTVGVLGAFDLGHRADWVVRGRHDLGPTANVNVGLINRDGEGASNRVLRVAEQTRVGIWGFDAHWAGSWAGSRHTGDIAQASLNYQSPRWFAAVEPHYVRPGFRDDLGFIPFTDFKGVNTVVSYSTEWRRGPLRSFGASAGTSDSHHYDGTLFRQQRRASFGVESRSDYALSVGWDGGRFEEFDDSVFTVEARARASNPFRHYGLGFSWGRRAGDPITFLTPFATWRFGERFTIGLRSALLYHTEDAQQHIVTFNYDLSPEQGIGGRVVAQTGGTNAYLAYRRSGYGGVETFLILGDPNARKFRARVMTKVVWSM